MCMSVYTIHIQLSSNTQKCRNSLLCEVSPLQFCKQCDSTCANSTMQYFEPTLFTLYLLQTKIGHVTYHRLPTAPSIPMPGQNYGYDEGVDGILRPQKLPTQDSTIGPAYYNVTHVGHTLFSCSHGVYIQYIDVNFNSFFCNFCVA